MKSGEGVLGVSLSRPSMPKSAATQLSIAVNSNEHKTEMMHDVGFSKDHWPADA